MKSLTGSFRLRPTFSFIVQKRKRLNVLCLLLLITSSFSLISHVIDSFDEYAKHYLQLKSDLTSQIFGDPFTATDAYIVSTYYYAESRSLGENAVAMVMLLNRNTMRDIKKYRMELIGWNGTSSVSSFPIIIEDSFAPCAFVNVVARTNLLPNMNKLEIRSNVVSFEIPFKHPRATAPKPVIICLAPQFVAENWQLFVTHAHISQRFGGHLHLYVTSMIDSYFNLVREYERQGYVTLDFWIRMKFANSSNQSIKPNLNAEWRNQAGAHTDCLYQYKETAEFVAFFDLDDIVFPRGYDNYYDEFSAYHSLFPDIQTFHYKKKEYSVVMQDNLSDFDFRKMFDHSNYSSEPAAGKVVARPENLDSIWIHESFNVPRRRKMFVTKNYIRHLQKPKIENQQNHLSYATNEFVEQPELAVNRSFLEDIQSNFEQMRNSHEIRRISPLLPSSYFYFPIVFKCYYDKFYHVPLSETSRICPNGEGCHMPQREDLKCLHSDADYKSGPTMFPITLHFHENSRWSDSIECYQ